MAQLMHVARYEFGMSIRRRGLWVAYGLLFVLYTMLLFLPSEPGVGDDINAGNYWQYAAQFVYQFNLFLPVAAGILAADRVYRDIRLSMRELQKSTPEKLATYIAAKYIGVTASLLLPVLVYECLTGVCLYAFDQACWQMVYAMPVTALAITVPAFCFVIAFSMFFPVFLPLRVYQILFTGYWFWGNFINPEVFPTLKGTILTASGEFAYQGFFGGYPSPAPLPLEYTSLEAILNIIVIFACSLLALMILYAILNKQTQKA